MGSVTLRRVVTLAALGIASAAAALIAQDKPTFKSGVDVVLIDVNVVDRSHSPVSNLKPDDFLVTVDGKPRKVASAQFIRYDTSGPVADEARAAAGETGRAEANVSAFNAPSRNVLVAIDTDSLDPVEAAGAKRAVNGFVDRLAAGDRVAIVTIPRLSQKFSLTRDRQATRKVLEAVSTSRERFRGQYNIGLAEAFDAERERARDGGGVLNTIIGRECCGEGMVWPCPPKDRGCPESVRGEVTMMQIQEHARGEQFLVALQVLGNSLGTIPGVKTIVLVTGGAPAPTLSGGDYGRVAEALARAEVSLYTILIERFAFDVSEKRLPPGGGADATVAREGAENATSAAGGVFMNTAGTLGGYFDRVATEMSGSYLLGIEVTPADRNGRPHDVEVKVARSGLQVRARKQYVIKAAAALAEGEAPGPDLAALAHPSNAARSIDRTSPEVRSVIGLAGDYVLDYLRQVVAVTAEERCQQTLSRWTARAGKGEWVVSQQRAVAADYLLIKRTESAAWSALRDVFEVDGAPVHPRDGRLKGVLTGNPDTAFDRAKAISDASASHELGFVDRTANVPTAALLFVHPADSGRFVFAREKAEVVDGNAIWQIAFTERATPTIVHGRTGDIPAEGGMWIDPGNGRIVQTVARWDMDGTVWEIAVQYRTSTDLAGLWVPGEMREVYTSATTKLECVTTYSNLAKLR